MDVTSLTEAYRRMLVIRGFEERASRLYRDGEIPGFVHLCIGQEATAVGACWWLTERDVITSTHRGHGHCLAKGMTPDEMFAELLARETGACRGRGGSMHIADPTRGVFGANGIVGAGLPIATGAGYAARLRDEGAVVVAMFGDGAVAQGAFHEAVNLAALWDLPVVFFCENNHVAEFSREADQQPVTLRERSLGYGVRYQPVDGYDVEAVVAAMAEVVESLRRGDGPVIVEADTYRWRGHYEGDPERYRTDDEVDRAKGRDPVAGARTRLLEEGCDPAALDRLEAAVAMELDVAVEAARRAPEPDAAEVTRDVTRPRRVGPVPGPTPTPVAAAGEGEAFRLMDAIREALVAEMEDDAAVVVAGVDVGRGGNVFGITRGLADRWPERVRDTPISEAAVMGLAVGGALAGLRPVVEIMYLDFIGVCFDQILNQAAKLPYMTGGRAQMPLVVRTQFGAGRSSGSQHSQSLEALLAHIPGLTVVMPSSPADAYGLLRASIQDPNPVVFIENRLTYGMKGPRPPAGHVVPLGQAAVAREGEHLTVVSMSRMVHDCLAAATTLAQEGVEVEVIDLRTVAPLDMATISRSVAKTGRLMVVHEAVRDHGLGAEVAARAAEEVFWDLDAPIVRLGGPRSPVPYAPVLERAWLPGQADVVAAARHLANV